MRAILASFLGWFVSMALPCFAARTVPVDATVLLNVETFQPTAVMFPEPLVSVTAPTGSSKIEGPYLFIIASPEMDAGRVFVIGQSGKIYTIQFRVHSPSDDLVSLVSSAASSHAAQVFGVPSLLRALRMGGAIPGATRTDLPLPDPQYPHLVLTQLRAVAMGSLRGLVVTIRNTGEGALTLDPRIGERSLAGNAQIALETWVWPPRLTIRALGITDEVLESQGETQLYVVFEAREKRP